MNTNAAFDFVQKMSGVKSPSVFVELWTEHARKQVETLTEQSKQLAALAQKAMRTTAEPPRDGRLKPVQYSRLSVLDFSVVRSPGSCPGLQRCALSPGLRSNTCSEVYPHPHVLVLRRLQKERFVTNLDVLPAGDATPAYPVVRRVS